MWLIFNFTAYLFGCRPMSSVNTLALSTSFMLYKIYIDHINKLFLQGLLHRPTPFGLIANTE